MRHRRRRRFSEQILSSIDVVDVLQIAWYQKCHGLLFELVGLVAVWVREAKQVAFVLYHCRCVGRLLFSLFHSALFLSASHALPIFAYLLLMFIIHIVVVELCLLDAFPLLLG